MVNIKVIDSTPIFYTSVKSLLSYVRLIDDLLRSYFTLGTFVAANLQQEEYPSKKKQPVNETDVEI